MLLEIIGDDIWNPNNWVESQHEHRIYFSDVFQDDYCIVDAIDYPYLSQFCWSIHDRRKYEKGYLYLRRSIHIPEFTGYGPGGKYISPLSGREVWVKQRTQQNEFLHQCIMRRTGIEPPTPAHKEVDHIDRDTRNCRRSNLIWATRSMNVKNSSAGYVNRGNLKRRGKTSTIITA